MKLGDKGMCVEDGGRVERETMTMKWKMEVDWKARQQLWLICQFSSHTMVIFRILCIRRGAHKTPRDVEYR